MKCCDFGTFEMDFWNLCPVRLSFNKLTRQSVFQLLVVSMKFSIQSSFNAGQKFAVG